MARLSATEAREVVAQARAGDGDLYELALALAPAAWIERGLLRAARQKFVGNAPAPLEAAFWWSRLIGSRGETAITLDAEVLHLLRHDLRHGPATKRSARIDLVRVRHASASPVLVFEETLIAQLIEPKPSVQRLVASLHQALRALLEGADPKAMALARWCVQALPALKLPPETHETASLLAYAAALKLGRLPESRGPLAAPATAPTWLRQAMRLAGAATAKPDATTPVAVDWIGETVAFEPGSLGAGERSITLPTELGLPALRVDVDGAVTPFGPRWLPMRRRELLELPAGTQALILTAQSGTRWRLEDADQADVGAPLSVLVIGAAGNQSPASQSFIVELERDLRRLGGLAPTARPILRHVRETLMPDSREASPARGRSVGLTVMDRSRWRAMTSEMLRDAAFIVVLATPELGSLGWHDDLLQRLRDQIEAPGSDPPIARASVVLASMGTPVALGGLSWLMPAPLVYLSYSSADAQWAERLEVLLKPFGQSNRISLWSDRSLRAGVDWRSEVEQAISRARVAVLLVSANYLASGYIQDHELPAILAARNSGQLTVVWIAVQPSDYHVSPIAEIQAAYRPDRPISALPPPVRDRALVEIAQKVVDATTDVAVAGQPPRTDAVVVGAHNVATSLVERWRRTRNAPRRRDLMLEFRETEVGIFLAQAMQALAMIFHVQSFSPNRLAEGFDEIDAQLWGLSQVPRAATRELDPSLPSDADVARLDFRHTRYATEYMYEQARRYIANELHPYQPEEDAASFANRIRGELASNWTPSFTVDAVHYLARFGSSRGRRQFTDSFGDPDLLLAALSAGPKDQGWPALTERIRAKMDAFVDLLLPLATGIHRAFLRYPTSLQRCVSFPEYLEGLTGLLVHYLQSASIQRPDTIAVIPPPWAEAVARMVGAFPSCFAGDHERLSQIARSQGNARDGARYIPIIEFADLTASVGNALQWSVRAAASQRLDARG